MEVTVKQSTDSDLMVLLSERSKPALQEIFRRYEAPVFNFLIRTTGRREIARELTQETFFRIWSAASSFDSGRGTVRGWIFTIALNLARSEMSRKEYTYRYVDPTGVAEADFAAADRVVPVHPHISLEKEENRRRVTVALGLLEPCWREVIVMKNYHALTFGEIARVANMPESTIKARYHRALMKIRELLQQQEATHGRELSDQ